MGEVKWIKITTNIFDDEKIQLIESLPDSDTILVIWFKLLALAGKSNNNGLVMISDKVPYTKEMLKTLFRRKQASIDLALHTFEQFGMIETLDNNAILISNWEKHQNVKGLDSIKEKNRLRQKRYREKKKLLELDIKEKDKDLDKERDIEGNVTNNVTNNVTPKKPKRFIKPTLEDINNYCKEKEISIDAESFIDFYESKGWKVGSSSMKDWKAAVRNWARRNAKDNKPTRKNIEQVIDDGYRSPLMDLPDDWEIGGN